MFTPIVIFIIYITFSFGIIAIDAYIRKKYENTMRELNKMCIVFKNTYSYGVFIHYHWQYELTKKGINFIAVEDLETKYQHFLIYEKFLRNGIKYNDREKSNVLPPINCNVAFSLNEIKILLQQHDTIRKYGADVYFVNRAKLMDDFISKTHTMLQSPPSPTSFFVNDYTAKLSYYTAALCFKHGAYIEAASFENFYLKTFKHVFTNYENIIKRTNIKNGNDILVGTTLR